MKKRRRKVPNPWPHDYPEPLAWEDTRLLHGAIEQMLREGAVIFIGRLGPHPLAPIGASVVGDGRPACGATLAEVLSKLAEVVGNFNEAPAAPPRSQK